jgi:hypothetical protein
MTRFAELLRLLPNCYCGITIEHTLPSRLEEKTGQKYFLCSRKYF